MKRRLSEEERKIIRQEVARENLRAPVCGVCQERHRRKEPHRLGEEWEKRGDYLRDGEMAKVRGEGKRKLEGVGWRR